MPYQPVELRPGVDIEKTPVLNQAGWSTSAAVRFFEGLIQKVGGWTHLNQTPIVGTARGMHAWADNTGQPYIAVGTEQRLELFLGGTLYDITPIRTTTNPAPSFSTVISTPTVTITDNNNGVIAGDWVMILVPVSVGGIVLQGFYLVKTVVDPNNYTITAASNATATVNNGGAVPSFATTNGQATVTVTLNNHGLIAGGTFTVQVPTTVGGITLSGLFSVIAPVTTNTFTITGPNNANATTSGSENGGNARLQYLIHSGQASASFSSQGGYGQGNYGGGNYGGGPTSVLTQLRYWSLSNFGQNLIANYNGSPLYVWQPPFSTGSVALQLNAANFPGALQPPAQAQFSFSSTTQQQIIALGCDNPLTSQFDPLLVRWCDSGDFTDWQALSTNLAGSFRIASGSKLIAGVSTSNFNVIWTDTDMWIMSWLGAPLVWGFQKVADAVDILAPLSAGVFRNVVIWPSLEGFYLYDGAAVRQLPCPVWDKFWFNLNQLQAYKVNAQVNSFFGEIAWGFPSASGNGEVDSRITYNIRENSWTYDDKPTSLARTSWIDDNVYNHAPTGCDPNGLIQQHEAGNDADGAPLLASATSGWFAISETDYSIFVERLVADFIVTGGGAVQITLQFQDWPGGPVNTLGPFTYSGTAPPYSIVRGRGRLARIIVSSSTLGTFWRLGRTRLLSAPAGRK